MLKKLRKFNLIMGSLHFVQALIMIIISFTVDKATNFAPTIYSYFLTFDSEEMRLITEVKPLFKLPFVCLVGLFFLLSAIFHFLVSTRKYNWKYNEDLENNINQFRWYEYALSSSIMICLIAILFGVYNVASLILIFFVNASMNLFGLLMEKMNKKNDKVDWLPFKFGAIVGIVPWIVILLYAFGNSNPAEVPWFVYAIFVSYFVFFNLFPINMILQYKKTCKWKDYLYGEKVYIVLSLVAKTVLAWLVFFGIMQP